MKPEQEARTQQNAAQREPAFLYEIGAYVEVIRGQQVGLVAPITDRQQAIFAPHVPVYHVNGVWYQAHELQPRSPFAGIAQDIAAIQRRRFVRQARNLENDINTAARAIAACPYEGAEAQTYMVSVLRGMLAGMAGLSATHPSCLDSKVTEAIQRLIAAINRSSRVDEEEVSQKGHTNG